MHIKVNKLLQTMLFLKRSLKNTGFVNSINFKGLINFIKHYKQFTSFINLHKLYGGDFLWSMLKVLSYQE